MQMPQFGRPNTPSFKNYYKLFEPTRQGAQVAMSKAMELLEKWIILRLRKTRGIFPLFLCLFTLVGQHSFAQESSRIWNSDLYFESYKNPVRSGNTDFGRIETENTQFILNTGTALDFTPTLAIEQYQSLNDRTNLGIEAGTKSKAWNNMVVSAFLERTYLNDSSFAFSQIKAGATYGNFWNHIYREELFTEVYAELFAFIPEKQVSYLAGTGWAKLGYRLYEKNNWVLDPLIFEYRMTDNTNQNLAGPDYRVVNLGPRATFWWSQPELSCSLFIAHSWTSSRQSEISPASDWFLFSLGVRF